MNTRTVYHIDQVTTEAAWIVDDCPDGAMSVTNDAEHVVAALLHQFGDRRFFYRDTDGNWDELQHDGTRFTGFAPASHINHPGGALSPARHKPPIVGIGDLGVQRAPEDDEPLFAAPAGVAGIERAPAAGEPPVGGGGEFSGAGASGGWDSPSESSSSDNGSSSSDSGGSASTD